MIRICYLCGEYPRATDTFIQREVQALRARGMVVATVSVRKPAAKEQGSAEQLAERKSTHYLLPCSPWRLFADHAGLLLRSPGRYLAALWMALSIRSPGFRALVYQLFYFAEAGLVAAFVRRNELRHIHNHAPDASGYVTMLASRLSGCSYSMTLHGFGILSEPSRWRLSDKLQRCLFAVCISWHARSQAMLWSSPSCWDRYHVIHCGIDLQSTSVRQHAGQGRRVLFVGRMDPVKGLPLLLEAVVRLRQSSVDIQLDLVGDGPMRGELEQLCQKLDLNENVVFHGYLSQAELRSLQPQVDVCVMTSFAEGIPVVLMEAMAAGLPVVAPRITGIPELVEDGVSGYLTTPGRVDELADRIQRLLADTELRQAFGRAGREKVAEQFCLETEVGKLAKLFEQQLS